MYDNRKALYLALILGAFSFSALSSHAHAEDPSLNPQLEEIKNVSEKKTTGMQSRSFPTPKYSEDKKDSDQADEKKSDDIDDKAAKAELTEDQKIWNKYKELADKNQDGENEGDEKSDEEAKKDEDTASVDDIEPANTVVDVEEQPKKELTGMAAILQQYKNSQESKGNMTTRSLGSID